MNPLLRLLVLALVLPAAACSTLSAQQRDRAIAIAAEKGFKRSVKLPVSAPFHSPLMKPAADAMRAALASAMVAVRVGEVRGMRPL